MTEDEIIQELASVNAAIKAIREGAQEYHVLNRSVRKADYAALLKERKELMNMLAQVRTGGVTLAGWMGR